MAIPLRRSDPVNITAGVRTFFVTSSIAGKTESFAISPFCPAVHRRAVSIPLTTQVFVVRFRGHA
jgi:hypothetical protein